MLKIKPPTHKIDGAAVYVSARDDAWNMPRVEAERDAQRARALEEVRAKAEAEYRAKHPAASDEDVAAVRDACVLSLDEREAADARSPVARYFDGKTRYQLSAPDWDASGAPCCARDFLRPGATPAEFSLARLDWRSYYACLETETTQGRLLRLLEAARLGLRGVKAEGYRWAAKPGETAGDEQIEALYQADPSLLVDIGAAVLMLSRPLDPDSELPR
jgi:hypothetical protein